MTNIEILKAVVSVNAGDMVAVQFEDWANGESIEEQNPNAIIIILTVLDRVTRGGNDMATEAVYWADKLKEELAGDMV